MTRTSSWVHSRSVFLLIAVLLPPLGLVLLWLRPQAKVLTKLLGSLILVGLTATHLYTFFGLRAEMDWNHLRPVVYFAEAGSHDALLERHRAEQSGSLEASRQVPGALPAEARPGAAALGTDGSPPPADRTTDGNRRYWTRFRGPKMDGHYREMPILTSWPPQGLPLIWKQPAGGGYASFVIADGRAFTIEQRRRNEVVAAYDLATGRELWTHAWRALFQESMGGDGPRATPTWDDGRLYALGATGEFRVLDATSGELIWSRNILSDNGAANLQWGMAASPLIVENKVIVLPGGPRGRSVVAYDKRTGEPVWTALNDQQAYTSPMLVTLAGQRQILVVGGRRAMGLTVEEGALLWDYPWTTQHDINAAQPIIVDDRRFFISAGYGHGAALVEINNDGSGFAAETVWQNTRMKNKFSASVLYQGHIYGLDEGILACVDVETGKRQWKGGRYGHGQVLLASGKLVIISDRGDLVLVEATAEEHRELARFPAIRGKTWNHPAIAEGILLVRNTREMAAFRIGAE